MKLNFAVLTQAVVWDFVIFIIQFIICYGFKKFSEPFELKIHKEDFDVGYEMCITSVFAVVVTATNYYTKLSFVFVIVILIVIITFITKVFGWKSVKKGRQTVYEKKLLYIILTDFVGIVSFLIAYALIKGVIIVE